ncbi:hypothetical protein M885DRAFT_577551 [Pelagophyceae sp. CCMP2097]|nr:hypothetical protein M885DRAFT_577551 [Pelagophyceae sp. CCMP2097]
MALAAFLRCRGDHSILARSAQTSVAGDGDDDDASPRFSVLTAAAADIVALLTSTPPADAARSKGPQGAPKGAPAPQPLITSLFTAQTPEQRDALMAEQMRLRSLYFIGENVCMDETPVRCTPNRPAPTAQKAPHQELDVGVNSHVQGDDDDDSIPSLASSA